MRTTKLVSFALAFVSAACGSSAAHTQDEGAVSEVTATESKLTPVKCADFAPVKANLGFLEPAAFAAAVSGLSCGVVHVPEKRSAGATAKRMVDLPVIVLKAEVKSTATTPLVMITGGPVTPSVNFLAALLPGNPFSPLRRDRDVILVGERGEEFANPRLDCPELDSLIPGIFRDDGVVHPITGADKLPKLAACNARHTAAGIDLSAYNVFEMAHDVNDAVHTLGHDKYSLYGVSFGTGLSQSVAKLFPASIEAVILDSPVTFWDARDDAHALTGNIHLDAARSTTDAWRTLFASCRLDATCNAAHPDLESTFRKMLKSYDDEPMKIPVTTPTGATATLDVKGDMIFGTLTNQFTPGAIPLMPQVIEGLAVRDATAVGIVSGMVKKTLIPGPDAAAGLTLSVDCSGWSFASPAQLSTMKDIDDLVQRYSMSLIREELDQCASVWEVPRMRDSWPAFAEPLKSDSLPVLIFPGKFDSNTHPFKAEQIRAHLPRAFVHVVPDRGHVTLSECPIAMINEFLGDPTHSNPNATCLSALTTEFK